MIVALHVDHHDIGQGEGFVGKGGGQVLFLHDAAMNHGGHFRVFRLNRGKASIEIVDLPKRAGGRALHADDEFGGGACVLVYRIGHHSGHDRADKAYPHDDDDLAAHEPLFVDQLLQAFQFGVVVGRRRQRKGFARGAGGGAVGFGGCGLSSVW